MTSIIKTYAAAAALFFAPLAGAAQNIKPGPGPDTTGTAAVVTGLEKTPLGRELAALAKTENVSFTFDPRLIVTEQPAVYDAKKKLIALNPKLTKDEKTVALAGALRRLWQEKSFNVREVENETLLRPDWKYALRQTMSADARAFGSLVAAERMVQGLTAAESAGTLKNDFVAAAGLAKEMKGDGLNAAEYLRLALEPAFKNITCDMSDNDVIAKKQLRDLGRDLSSADMAMDGDRDAEADSLLVNISTRMKAAPDSAAFDALIRSFGGMSLDAREKSVLKAPVITPQKLLHEYPYLSAHPRMARDATVREMNETFERKIAWLKGSLDRRQTRRNAGF